MTLSKEDKARIREEERFRAKERKAAESRDQGIGCLIMIGVLVVIFGIVWLSSPDRSQEAGPKKKPSEIVRLHASGKLSSEQLVLTNDDDFAWLDVRLHLNYRFFRSNYIKHLPRLGPGETISIGLREFLKGDGARFNPYTHEVREVFIMAKTPGGGDATITLVFE